MKRQILRGEGVQGMCLTLSVCDMFAANQVAEELKTVIIHHQLIERYNSMPYDQRKDSFPDEAPKRIEVSEKTLQNLYQLMLKLSYEVKSTLFDEEDEEDKKESAESVESDAVPTDEKFCVQLYKVGPTKLNIIKVIREFTLLSLKEAKDMVDAAECRSCTVIAKDLSYSEALNLRNKLVENNAVASVVSQSAEEMPA